MEEEDEAERAAKAEADKVPSAVFVDPRQLSKKARKKAEAGVGMFPPSRQDNSVWNVTLMRSS